MKNIKDKPWFNNAVALSIAVVLYVLLTNWGAFRGSVGTFFHYFSPVILGAIIAYIVNPLSGLYGRTIFCWIKKEKAKVFLSNLLAFVTVVLFLVFLLLMLVPQLIESVATFAGNLDGYVASFRTMLESLGVSATKLDLDKFISSSESLIDTITDFVKKNLSVILSTSVGVGMGAVQFLISFLLSIYLLADKTRLKKGAERFLVASMSGAKYEKLVRFLRRCHSILNRYIVFNLLDSLIVGSANAIFMAIVGMPYVGLVSFVVAVFNLIPTFGPVIGAIIGGFILLMVNPWHALAFLIFTTVLQTIDGYILKPKLFGDSLGVSGLWILVGVIVGGRAFGVVGILLAIPAVAILDVLYGEYLLPWMEERKKENK
ncbi:MAG: AI-2E family transporter [Clostridia bacterium]|nr:AI-2E family transporter [Clostridia bacterium]